MPRDRLAYLRRNKADDESYCQIDKNLSTIYIVGEITHKVASSFRRYLRQIEGSKRGASIIVEINSPGGDIEAGLMICDSIELCKKPVTTRVTGQAMSMAALVLAAGKTREALSNSSIMVHQGTYWFKSPADEMQVEVDECKRIEKLCNDLLDRWTKQESGYWEKRCNGKNLYLTAETALAERLIDSILRRP